MKFRKIHRAGFKHMDVLGSKCNLVKKRKPFQKMIRMQMGSEGRQERGESRENVA